MCKRSRDAVTQFENKTSELCLQTRYVRQKLETYNKEIIADISHEYEQGRIIISRVSDWKRLQLSKVLPEADLEYFHKQVFFSFSIIQGVPIVTKVHQLDQIQDCITKSFLKTSPLYFTSHATMDIVDQCQEWFTFPMILEDNVVWDNKERTSGLACHGIEYVYTIPKK